MELNQLLKYLSDNDIKDFDIDSGYINIRYGNYSIDTQIDNPNLLKIIEAHVSKSNIYQKKAVLFTKLYGDRNITLKGSHDE